MIAPSLKDLAKRAPAEIIRADSIAALKVDAYEQIWANHGIQMQANVLVAAHQLFKSCATSRGTTWTMHRTKILKTHSKSTANRHHSLIARMLALAVEWDILKLNSVVGLRKFRETSDRGCYLLPEKLAKLLKALTCMSIHSSYCVHPQATFAARPTPAVT